MWMGFEPKSLCSVPRAVLGRGRTDRISNRGIWMKRGGCAWDIDISKIALLHGRLRLRRPASDSIRRSRNALLMRLSIRCRMQSDCLKPRPRRINGCEIGPGISFLECKVEEQGWPRVLQTQFRTEPSIGSQHSLIRSRLVRLPALSCVTIRCVAVPGCGAS